MAKKKTIGHKKKLPESGFDSSYRHTAVSRNQCPSNKLGWQAKKDAKLAMRRAQSKSTDNHVCRIYRCRQCGRWHFTSQRDPK